MSKHAHIADLIASGYSDEEICASPCKWKIRIQDVRWNRRHYNRTTDNASRTRTPTSEPQDTESADARRERISRQYRTLERMATRIISGQLPSLIVSGPPGLGKTYTVEQQLKEADTEVDIIRGTISASGLYMALYWMRDGGVVVMDDCDAVFRDEETLNILKIALDSSDVRTISWRKQAAWLDNHDIPQSFEFTGSVVFCTNLDFEAEINRGSKMSPHYQALVDRSLYLSLTLRSIADYLCRIEQVVIEEKQFEQRGLTAEEAKHTMNFIRDNAAKFYTLSIRSALQVAACRLMDPEYWIDDVLATKMRTL